MKNLPDLADVIIRTRLMIAECNKISEVLNDRIERINKILKDGNKRI